MKRLFFAIGVLLTFTACSSDNQEIKSVEASKKQVYVPTPGDEVAKLILDGQIEESRTLFTKTSTEIEVTERDTLDKCIEVFTIMLEDTFVEAKEPKLTESVRSLKNKISFLYEERLDDSESDFVKLVEEVIRPMTEYNGSKKIDIGMDRIQLIVSMGYPNDINKTTTANNVSEQWVYRDEDIYVYLDNGKVTSFQN